VTGNPTAACPHCGKPDAPTDEGVIDRHRRADADAYNAPANEICYGGGLAVGEACHQGDVVSLNGRQLCHATTTRKAQS
jgi:hypothetical protein